MPWILAHRKEIRKAFPAYPKNCFPTLGFPQTFLSFFSSFTHTGKEALGGREALWRRGGRRGKAWGGVDPSMTPRPLARRGRPRQWWNTVVWKEEVVGKGWRIRSREIRLAFTIFFIFFKKKINYHFMGTCRTTARPLPPRPPPRDILKGDTLTFRR